MGGVHAALAGTREYSIKLTLCLSFIYHSVLCAHYTLNLLLYMYVFEMCPLWQMFKTLLL